MHSLASTGWACRVTMQRQCQLGLRMGVTVCVNEGSHTAGYMRISSQCFRSQLCSSAGG